MKTRPIALLGLVGLFLFVFVHMTQGSAIRERRDAKGDRRSVTKKQSPPVEKITEEKLNANGKIKISNLKPCISKAFCEVNSIVNNPTYDANKEFYTTLNRLNKFTEEEQSDNGSSSLEDDDDEPSSEESSYERPAPPPGPPGRDYYPGYGGYRHGKTLDTDAASDKLKKKNKKKLKKVALAKTSVNGTEILVNNSTSVNRTSRVVTEEEKEQREFLARKTRELNVAEDLAALIKISSEIGQALRSPRRCRELFKKCTMTYDQIINIFNHTQTIETTEKEIPTTESPRETTTTEAPASIETSKTASSESNRKQKSRHDFSDEDIEYMTDTELHQPIRTYSLFSPSEQHDTRHPEEILVEEAFKKFDNTFPVSSAVPKNIDFLKKHQQKPKSIVIQQRPISSEEEEDGSYESSSGSRERPGFRIDPQYSSYRHRTSAEEEEVQPSAEVEEAEPKEQNDKEASEAAEDTEAEQAGSSVDADAGAFEEDAADDSEAPPEKPKKKQKPTQEPEESSEENDESSNEDFDQKPIHTRDEYPAESEQYEQVRPNQEEDEERPLKVSHGNKKGSNRKSKRRPKPQNDENSSEEEQPEQEMPPPDSEFYGHLQGMNDGQGADGIPDQPPKKGKGSSGQRKPGRKPWGYGGNQEGSGGKPEGYGGPGGYGGAQSDYPGGSEPTQQSQSFMQSIMSWFSGSSKQGSQEQQPQPYGDGGYGQKPYGGNEPPTYDDYKKGRPSNYPPPQSYNSGPYSDEGYQSGPPPSHKRRPGRGRRPPQGRDDESSEEVEDDAPRKKKSQGNSRPQSSKNSSPQRNKPGPPPPVVVIPQNEEAYAPNAEYGTVVKSESDKQNNQDKRSKPKQKQKPKEEPEASEEESRETSSEEVKQNSKPSSSSNDKKKAQGSNNQNQQNGGVPSYENYYTSIFGAAQEPPKNVNKNRKPQKGTERENPSLLLSEFDKISNTFSTSADKIPDWSEEDNPKQKINVGSLASNGKQSKGKYTVNKNKNKKGGQTSYEANSDNKEAAASSEEEEDKKK